MAKVKAAKPARKAALASPKFVALANKAANQVRPRHRRRPLNPLDRLWNHTARRMLAPLESFRWVTPGGLEKVADAICSYVRAAEDAGVAKLLASVTAKARSDCDAGVACAAEIMQLAIDRKSGITEVLAAAKCANAPIGPSFRKLHNRFHSEWQELHDQPKPLDPPVNLAANLANAIDQTAAHPTAKPGDSQNKGGRPEEYQGLGDFAIERKNKGDTIPQIINKYRQKNGRALKGRSGPTPEQVEDAMGYARRKQRNGKKAKSDA